MKLKYDKNIYPKTAVLAGVSYYSDLLSATITETDNFIELDNFCYKDIHLKEEDILKILNKYILQIATRHIIADKNKTERELIIGRALYGSCLEEK